MKYLCNPHIIPTIVPNDWASVISYAAATRDYATGLHVDIDDGQFVPQTTWPFQNPSQMHELDALRLSPGDEFEAHLMIRQPDEVYVRFARAGFKRITLHVEAFADAQAIQNVITLCRAEGAKEMGVAIKIDTPISKLNDVISACDYVLVMSIVHIGPQGQPFDERALSRVEELHASYPELMVAVDGGISESNVEALVRAGANWLSIGSAISKSENPGHAYVRIHERAMRGCAPLPVAPQAV